MTKPLQQRGADRRRFHVLYKTTCLVTGRWYIGMHSTDDLADGYMGSGKRLTRSLNKYGRANHICVILEQLSTRAMLVEREVQIVTQELIADPMCMNLAPGGNGNWGWGITTEEREAERLRKLSETWNKPGFRESFSAKTTGRKRSEETKAKMRSRWTPERLAAQAERLRAIVSAKPKIAPKPYTRRCERPDYVAPPDKATQSKAGWAKLKADETKLAATKAAMAKAKQGRVTVNDGSTIKMVLLAEAEQLIALGWTRGRPIAEGRIRANGRTRST